MTRAAIGLVTAAVLALAMTACATGEQGPQPKTVETPSRPATPDQVRAIAKEAYIYGFPIVDNYRVMYAYFVNKKDPEYKGDWNQIHNTARVYTPADTTIQTPNSDTRTRRSAPTCGPSRWC